MEHVLFSIFEVTRDGAGYTPRYSSETPQSNTFYRAVVYEARKLDIIINYGR